MIFKGLYILQPGTYTFGGTEKVVSNSVRFSLTPVGNSDKYLVNGNWFKQISTSEIEAIGNNLTLII